LDSERVAGLIRAAKKSGVKSRQADIEMSGRTNILLLEDDEIDRMAFDRFLQEHRMPYNCRKAATIAEFREQMKSHKFDVVISDYQLPDGTALDIIPEAEARGVPVIVVTGAGNEEIAVDAMKAGAHDYLIKDQQRNYLHVMPVTVKNAIERHLMEQEREKLIKELQSAIADIKTLRGMLPICARCKKIRDDKGYWNHLEKYIQEHTDAQFTHGYCPDCAKELFNAIETGEE
jgi:DNA-binding NtrC family response regulator